MGIKITSIKLRLLDDGIQDILKSDQIKADLLNVANQLKNKLDALDLTDDKWKVEVSERSKRAVVNISTDDPVYRYREMKHRTVADLLAASKIKGKR